MKEDSRLILWRLGRILHNKPLGPGIIVYYPGIDEVTVVRMQLDSVNINDVDMLTLDMIEITVSFRIVFVITDPIKAHVNVKDYQGALKLIARSKLRDMVGGSIYEELVRSSTKNQKDLKVLVSIRIAKTHSAKFCVKTSSSPPLGQTQRGDI